MKIARALMLLSVFFFLLGCNDKEQPHWLPEADGEYLCTDFIHYHKQGGINYPDEDKRETLRNQVYTLRSITPDEKLICIPRHFFGGGTPSGHGRIHLRRDGYCFGEDGYTNEYSGFNGYSFKIDGDKIIIHASLGVWYAEYEFREIRGVKIKK